MKYFWAFLVFSSFAHAQEIVHLSGTNEVLSFKQEYRKTQIATKKITVESVCVNGNSSNHLQGRSFEFCSKEIQVPTCNVSGVPRKRKSIQYDYACDRGSERIVEGIIVHTLNYYDPCYRSVDVEYCEVPRTITANVTIDVVNKADFSGSSLLLTNGSLAGNLSNDVLLGFKETSSIRSIDDFNLEEEKKIEVLIEDLSPVLSLNLNDLDYVFRKKKLDISIPALSSDLVMFQVASYKKPWWMRSPLSWGVAWSDQSKITDGSVRLSFDTLKRGNYLFIGRFRLNPSFKYLNLSAFEVIESQSLSFEARL